MLISNDPQGLVNHGPNLAVRCCSPFRQSAVTGHPKSHSKSDDSRGHPDSALEPWSAKARLHPDHAKYSPAESRLEPDAPVQRSGGNKAEIENVSRPISRFRTLFVNKNVKSEFFRDGPKLSWYRPSLAIFNRPSSSRYLRKTKD